MQRRTLIRMAALSGLLAGIERRLPALAQASPAADPTIHTVLLVCKCHLDVGFSLTQARVMRKYFDTYYPQAIRTAAAMRQAGPDRYTWLTGSWLLYEYLEQASAADRKVMEAAVVAGDISYHALPFSWQTEMLDRSMIDGSFGFVNTLDSRFGRRTISAKMTDVPGHSRGLVAPLAAAGVQLLDIGVNAASTPPDVPDVFLWKDPAGHSVAMLYHRHDYGSVLEIPGTGVAVDVEVRNDNSGPHTPAEIAAIYAKLRARFPNATIKATDLNEVARAVEPVRATLPVVTGEIGDTWIYGCASDPDKVARYREMARLRRAWLQQGRFAAGDATDRDLLRRLLLAVEHTWGTDTKTYLDNQHYRPHDLNQVLSTPNYVLMETSWQEKRDDINQGVATLPAALKQEAGNRLDALRAQRPTHDGMRAHDPSQPYQTEHYLLAIDPQTGAIVRLTNRKTRQDWASAQNPLALFTYQTLSAAEYADYIGRYITLQTDWAPRDFGKPGIDAFHAEAREWHPRVVGCWTDDSAGAQRMLLELAINDPAAIAGGNVAWPDRVFLNMTMPKDEARIDLRLTSFGKAVNRMPEAMWLTFAPVPASSASWSFDKVEQPVAPSEVVKGGGRAMHAISEALRYTAAPGRTLELRTLDAPVVALGRRCPINFSTELPDLADGIHVSLFNNAWGTNYPQWSGGDWSYRFQLSA